MKKIFLMMAAMAMTAGMIACSGKTESSAAASAEEVSVEEAAADANANAVIYKNEKFGFSVQLPEGFEPQNDDKQMEEERGGKLYIWQGCMVDMQGADISAKVASVKEQLEIDAAFITIDESKGEKLIQKDMKDDELIAKWTDDWGFRALYYKYEGKTKYIISITYAPEKEKEFNEQVDKIIASLKTK